MSTQAELVKEINALMGEGTMKLGSDVKPISRWSTGVFPIDCLLDGGLPVGRFTEVYGDYSTLKSYLGYKTIATVQALGGTTALVDAEHSFDTVWAEELGVDVKRLLIQRPTTGEQAIGAMEVLIRNGYDFVMWDSIAATQPKQYAEKKPGEDSQPGSQARMMSAGLRRLNSVNTVTSILAINQTRMNIGMTFGPRDAMPGGRAMPFYASYRLRLQKAGKVTEDTDVWEGEKLINAKQMIKQKIKVQLEKSKLSAPNREAWMEYDLRTGTIDEVGFIIGWGIENGYIETGKGGLYKMDQLAVRGREKFRDAFEQNDEVVQWMKAEMSQGHLQASPGGITPAKSKAGSRSAKS